MDMMDGETEIRDYALQRVIMLSDGLYRRADGVISILNLMWR